MLFSNSPENCLLCPRACLLWHATREKKLASPYMDIIIWSTNNFNPDTSRAYNYTFTFTCIYVYTYTASFRRCRDVRASAFCLSSEMQLESRHAEQWLAGKFNPTKSARYSPDFFQQKKKKNFRQKIYKTITRSSTINQETLEKTETNIIMWYMFFRKWWWQHTIHWLDFLY